MPKRPTNCAHRCEGSREIPFDDPAVSPGPQKAKKPPAEAAVSSRINLLSGLAIACPQKLPDLRHRGSLPAQVGQVRAVSWLVGRSKPKLFHTTKDGWQKRDKQHGRTSAPLQLLHPRLSAWLTGCPPTNMPGRHLGLSNADNAERPSPRRPA